jgi:hypothetical protein
MAEVTGGWTKLHHEDARNILSVMKSRILRWVGHLARMNEVRKTKHSGRKI